MAPDSHGAVLVARGFTLVETMIVVAILAIFAAMAGPSFIDMVKTAKLRSAASDFYSSLLSARSEAIKRRTNMSVTPINADWAKGWSVTFVDPVVPTQTDTLQSHEALATDVAVQVNATGDAANPITYGTNGRVSSAAPTLIFHVPGAAAAQARCVSLDPAGMPRIHIDTNGAATDGCN